MSQENFDISNIVSLLDKNNDFNPPRTIEYRHIIAAVPGDTLQQKYDWLQNAIHDVAVFRDTDSAARRMAAALGEIEDSVERYKNGSALSCGNGPYAMAMIATIIEDVQ